MARSRATTTYDDEDAEMEVVVIFVSFQIVQLLSALDAQS